MKTLQFLALLFLMNVASAAVYACSCFYGGPPCQSYGNTPVVFSGRVLSVETFEAEREGIPFKVQQRRVKVAILEVFKGIQGQTVDLITGQGGGDCGYNFKINESYLVYGWENKGVFSTGICSRTRPMTEASEDLEYIRSLDRSGANGRISGSVFVSKPRRSDETWQPNPTLSGLEITAIGPNSTTKVQTDNEGNFVFEDRPPGDYVLRALAPPGLFPEKVEEKVKLAPKGCSIQGIVFVPQTVVKGKVLDEKGAPAIDIGVNLIPVEYIDASYQRDTYFNSTDASGNFIFRNVPSGKYYLGVRLSRITDPTFKYPRFFFPGTQRLENAAVIEISEGQILNDQNFQLPAPLPNRVISGIVTFPDGKPVENASVSTEETEYSTSSMGYSDGVTDAKGRFSINRRTGLKYKIRIWIDMPDGNQRHAEPVAVNSTGDVKGLKFVISEPGGSCSKCRK